LKKIISGLLLAVLLLLSCLALFVLSPKFGASVMGWIIPPFPQLPEAELTLSEKQRGEIYFPSSTVYDFDVMLHGMNHALKTTAKGVLYLPGEASKENPVPAMVVIHGSGGIRPGRENEYGNFLSEKGIAVFVLDYYSPRGVTEEVNYLAKVVSVTEFDAASDAYHALKALNTHPSIDSDRIGVMGFSYGGMAVKVAMDERVHQAIAPETPGFAVFVDYYGPCFQVFNSPRPGKPKEVLTLRGDNDASNDLQACLKREQEMRDLGYGVEAYVYEGAGHAWEHMDLMKMDESAPYLQGCEIHYDAGGSSSVNGKDVMNVAVETPRLERIAIRLAGGHVLTDCVRKGYIGGRHEITKQKSDRQLFDFLSRTLLAQNTSQSTH